MNQRRRKSGRMAMGSLRHRAGKRSQVARLANAAPASSHPEANGRASERADARYAASLKSYEAAVRLIQKQDYHKALEILEKVASEGPPEVADRARVYMRFCNQKLQVSGKVLKSAEDFYVAGISDLNSNKIDRAIEYLSKAQKLDPRRSEIHYALAAGYARRGDPDPAIAHLKASIHLDPQTRIQARHEEDFEPVASDPRFTELVSNAKRSAAARA